MKVDFVIVEFKVSNFFYNLIEDNHKSPVLSVSGEFFAWELFLVTIYLYVFQINHKPSVPQMGATKRNNFGQRPTVYSANYIPRYSSFYKYNLLSFILYFSRF